MLKKIVKYGNSQAIVLPREALDEVGLGVDAYADVVVANGHIEIHPVDVIRRGNPEVEQFVDELYARREKVFKKLAE